MKEHQQAWRSAILVGVLSLVAAACGPTATPPGASPTIGTGTAASPTPAGEVATPGGRVIEGTFSDMKTFSPILVSDCPSCYPTGLMYETLLTLDPQTGEPKANLATKWETSSDGLTYTFTLDDKANWSDGKPVTSEDVLTGMKGVAMSKKTVRHSTFQDVVGFTEVKDGTGTDITGFKAISPKQFSVTMKQVSCPAIEDIGVSNYYILPTHVWGKYVAAGQADAIDSAPENTAPTVVNGPFILKEWRQGDQVIMTKSPNYWRGKVLLDEYVFKVVADTTVLAAQLKTGELTYGQIDPKDVADIERQENLKVNRYMASGYTYIGWRQGSPTAPALSDKRVRQALAYGLDTSAYLKAVLFGEGVQQFQHSLPIQWAAAQGLNEYKFDPAKAESLLKEAGYAKGADGIYAKDGKPISFTITTNAGNKKRETLAQIASEQYKAIGIDAKTKFDAFPTIVEKITTGNPEIEALIIGWTGLAGDPDPYQIWHSSQIPDPSANPPRTGFGFTFFKHPDVDKAIEEARNPSNGDCSTATRQKHYQNMNKILNEEQPYNFGVIETQLLVSAKNIQGVAPTTFDTRGFSNVHEWWIKK